MPADRDRTLAERLFPVIPRDDLCRSELVPPRPPLANGPRWSWSEAASRRPPARHAQDPAQGRARPGIATMGSASEDRHVLASAIATEAHLVVTASQRAEACRTGCSPHPLVDVPPPTRRHVDGRAAPRGPSKPRGRAREAAPPAIAAPLRLGQIRIRGGCFCREMAVAVTYGNALGPAKQPGCGADRRWSAREAVWRSG
jgi:hypothetical protein